MIRINLIPPEYTAAQDKKNQQILLGTGGSLLVFFLVIFWVLKSREASSLEGQITQAEADLAKYQSIVSQIERIEADKSQLSDKQDVIRNMN